MKAFFVVAARRSFLVALTALAAAAFAAAVGATLLDVVESAARVRLSFELALRVYVLVALGVWLWGFTAWTLARPATETVVAWAWLVAASLGVAAVCVLDRHHELAHEPSWIRFTTGGCLLVVAALGIALARGRPGEPPPRAFRIAWVLAAAGAVFLALDEMFELHEIAGRQVLKVVALPHALIDWITLGYAAVGVALVLWAGPRILRVYGRDHPVLHLFAGAAGVFAVSQVLDSTDRFFLPFMRKLGTWLSTKPDHVLSDVWYVFWRPRVTFNVFEEVLENLAAALLAAATLLVLMDRSGLRVPAPWLRPRRGLAAASWATLAAVCVGLGLWARPGVWTSSPVIGHHARLLIGPEHGLLHADAGAYARGPMVANEGVGNVLTYIGGVVRTLPMPSDKDAELDAVAADDSAVYVSLSQRHKIMRYTAARGWSQVVTAADGMATPEGLTIVDSTLYAVDQTLHRLYTVDLSTRHVSITTLDDPRCRAPEGIAFHPGLGELLITDDRSGYIVAMRPGGPLRTFASSADGLEAPEDLAIGEDGTVYVSDPGRREVIQFSPAGQVLKRIAFTRLHGDVVGVDVVGAGARRIMYVVTADARHNDSFVPSGLWEVTLAVADSD